MATPHSPSILAKRHIRKIGADLRVARLRRRLPMKVVADRALVTRNTLAKVEKGDPSVSFGIYASVMQALNLVERLPDVAAEDHVGIDMANEQLPKRIRARSGRV